MKTKISINSLPNTSSQCGTQLVIGIAFFFFFKCIPNRTSEMIGPKGSKQHGVLASKHQVETGRNGYVQSNQDGKWSHLFTTLFPQTGMCSFSLISPWSDKTRSPIPSRFHHLGTSPVGPFF